MKVRIKLIPRKNRPRTHEEAKRFAANVSRGMVIACAVIALVLVANRWARKEELRGVHIIGNRVLDSAEIMGAAGLSEREPLERVGLDSVEARIAAHPFIERASVYRGAAGMLEVEIVERAPVAATLIDGAPFYLDSLGVLLPYRFSRAAFDLPLVSGIGAPRQLVAGRPRMDVPARQPGGAPNADTGAPSAARPEGQPAQAASVQTASAQAASAQTTPALIDSARTREALEVLATLRAYDDGLYRQISEIVREPSGEYQLRIADGGVAVKLGLPAEMAPRLKKLDRFLTTVLAARGARAASAIDLRWKGQVVVRWQQSAPAEL